MTRRSDAAVAAAVSALVAGWAAVVSGVTHPDEIFQFLEPAHHLAFGFGSLSWEWERGIRNWAVPGALAGGMKLVDLLGWTSVWGHRFGVAAVVALLTYPGIRAVIAYARRRIDPAASPNLAYLALAAVVLWGPSLYFLGRTLGEPMGALLGMAAMEALDRDERPATNGFRAGLWLGLAVVVRYAFAAFAVAAVIQELGRRRWRAVFGMLWGGALVALALGGLDWATWGDPFHSMIGYLKFNLGPEAGDQFGREHFWFYALVSGWLPWPLLLGLPWLDLRRLRFLVPSILVFLALCATAHKEDRFLYPVVFWLSADLAPAFAMAIGSLWHRVPRARRIAHLGLACFSLASAGVYLALPDLSSDLFRATVRAGRDPALTGLLIVGQGGIWGGGGTFYLGRKVPIEYGLPGEGAYRHALKNRKMNRAIAAGGVGRYYLEAEGFRVIDEFGFQGTLLLGR